MPEPRQGPWVGWASMWPLAPTCIMAPMTSVTFLGINLNGGKTCVWKHKREGGQCVPSSRGRAESPRMFSGRGHVAPGLPSSVREDWGGAGVLAGLGGARAPLSRISAPQGPKDLQFLGHVLLFETMLHFTRPEAPQKSTNLHVNPPLPARSSPRGPNQQCQCRLRTIRSTHSPAHPNLWNLNGGEGPEIFFNKSSGGF